MTGINCLSNNLAKEYSDKCVVSQYTICTSSIGEFALVQSVTALISLQGVLKAVEKRERDVKRMNEVGAELAEKLDNYHGMSREARNDQQTTNDRYERIRLELLNREKLIEAQVNSSDQFMTALQELEMDLTGVDAAIADESVGSDSEELKRQLAELQVRIILTGN